MNSVGGAPLPIEGAGESRSPGPSASRMQQRLEWERALLAAQPREPGDSRAAAPRAPPVPESSANPPSAESPAPAAGGPDTEAAAPERAGSPLSEPRSARATELPTPAAARALEAASPNAAAERPGRDAPAARLAAAPRSERASPVWQRASEPEPAAMGFFRDEDEVRFWLRDRRVGRDAGSRLAQGLRRALALLGLQLRSFTLNGTRLVGDETSQVDSRREDGVADPERVLDTFY